MAQFICGVPGLMAGKMVSSPYVKVYSLHVASGGLSVAQCTLNQYVDVVVDGFPVSMVVSPCKVCLACRRLPLPGEVAEATYAIEIRFRQQW